MLGDGVDELVDVGVADIVRELVAVELAVRDAVAVHDAVLDDVADSELEIEAPSEREAEGVYDTLEVELGVAVGVAAAKCV